MKQRLLGATAFSALLMAGAAFAQTEAPAQDPLIVPGQGGQAPEAGGATPIEPGAPVEGTSGGQVMEPGTEVTPQAVPEGGLDNDGVNRPMEPAEDPAGQATDPAADTTEPAADADASGEAEAGAEAPAEGETEAAEPAAEAESETGAAGEAAQGERAEPSEQEAAAAVERAPEVNEEQSSRIRSFFSEGDRDYRRVDRGDIDIDITVGIFVPSAVELYPVPPVIVEYVPAYSGYYFFILADGTIVIVDPAAYVIVYVI